MKKRICFLLTAIACLTLVFTSCKKPEPDIIQTLTAGQTVLKVLDGMRKENTYKTIDGTLVFEDIYENEELHDTYTKTGNAEYSIKGVFEYKKLNADITAYEEWKEEGAEYGDERKAISLDYIRGNRRFGYSQTAEISVSSDGKTEFDATTKEILTQRAKETVLDTYSHWSVPEFIAYFLNGYHDDRVIPGMFDIIECLKKTRDASATIENNIAKWLVNLWDVKAKREGQKYTITIDANKAIDKTVEYLDDVFDYAVKNKDKTLNEIFEEENSPVRLFFSTLLYGVTAKDAEKIWLDISSIYEGIYGDYDNFVSDYMEGVKNHDFEGAGENETAFSFLKRVFLEETTPWGDKTLDETILSNYPLRELFYSYNQNNEQVITLMGWKDLKEKMQNAIGENFNIDFNLNPDFVIENIKFEGKWQQYFDATIKCEIYFNRSVTITDLSEYYIDNALTATGEPEIYEDEPYIVKLGNAKFKCSLTDGAISLGMYLNDDTKLFDEKFPSTMHQRDSSDSSFKHDIVINTPIIDEDGAEILSPGNKVEILAYAANSGYIYVIVYAKYSQIYEAKFDCTTEKVRLKDYKLQ